jgi:hypothetical protein
MCSSSRGCSFVDFRKQCEVGLIWFDVGQPMLPRSIQCHLPPGCSARRRSFFAIHHGHLIVLQVHSRTAHHTDTALLPLLPVCRVLRGPRQHTGSGRTRSYDVVLVPALAKDWVPFLSITSDRRIDHDIARTFTPSTPFTTTAAHLR